MTSFSLPLISDVLADCALASNSAIGDICSLWSDMELLQECSADDVKVLAADSTSSEMSEDAIQRIKDDIANGNEIHIFEGAEVLEGAAEMLGTMWPTGMDENFPEVEEVMLEVEVISSWIDEKDERNLTNLDDHSPSPEPVEYSSDYGSETDHTSEMDLSQNGSLDLSRTGPYANTQPLNLNLNQINTQQQHHPHNGVLGLSLPGSNHVVNGTGSSYLHFSGGTTSLESGRADMEHSGLLDLSKTTAGYYQMPRIKLEPGLGIDPTIVYKPELDYNHNIPPHSKQPIRASDTNLNINAINALNSLKYDTQQQQQLPNTVYNGQPKPESTLKREQFEEVSQSDAKVKVEEVYSNACQIPLTVTSTEDDNDSGTESIVSEESDKSSSNASKGDRKRPGRKKGQVSKVYHLWEFIRDILADDRYCPTVIKWENEQEGIFRVIQSEVAAGMWGAKKNNRTKMTYEKMSRSIRYSRKEGYFGDLPKDKGYPKKLCFKFGKKAHGWSPNVKTYKPSTYPVS